MSDSDSIIDIEELEAIANPETEDDILSGNVSARTGGIRGKRYGDPELASSDIEEGEIVVKEECLSEEDVDIVGDDEQVEKPAFAAPCIKPEILDFDPEQVFSPPSNTSRQGFSNLKRSLKHEIATSEDIYDIQSRVITYFSTPGLGGNGGVEKLKSGFRDRQEETIQVSDDEDRGGGGELNFSSDEFGSEDSEDEIVARSNVSELNHITRNLRIKEPFAERFPEVSITELSLAPQEALLPLGSVTQVVEDFVVVRASCPDKVLDLDSMIFNADRRCVGYVFEVLGPVADPHYSLRFNTHSDIASYGLAVGVDLFFAENPRYHRILMGQMLGELAAASEGEESDESEVEEEEEEEKRVISRGRRRLRTTHNYSVSYTKQPPPHPPQQLPGDMPLSLRSQQSPARNFYQPTAARNFQPPPQLQPRKLQQQPQLPPRKLQPRPQLSSGNAPQQKPRQSDCNTRSQKPETKSKPSTPQFHRDMPKDGGAFRNSVLASFFDPFSLEEKPS